jgi:RelA/SpoT family (p)ppGpp synthetase
LKSRRREREHYISKFSAPIEKRLHEEGVKFEIQGRPKHFYSIYNKMLKRSKPLEEIYDLFAIRLILDTEDNNQCFAVYGIVSDIYIPNPDRFKNYISVPKKNGYQSIHTTVVGPEGKMVEVQIRTRSMHEVAEKGIAAHWMYKGNKSGIDDELTNWANWVRDIFENAAEGQVPTQQLMESFKLNLYQDEIYVFTPKGELRILPTGATPVDFAYEIHSNIGDHCLASKINGRIVPLDTALKSGDQVEIITSKNQTPNPDWEKFVVSHKAKSHIRRWIREEQRKAVDEGKEIWEKRLKKAKFSINEDSLLEFVHRKRIDNLGMFYLALRQEKLNPDDIIAELQEEQKHPQQVVQEEEKEEGLFKKFISVARDVGGGGIVLNGSHDNFMHQYAKCCHPIPGDPVVGYVTTGEGIKIHRRTCRNIQMMIRMEPSRIMEVSWPSDQSATFVSGLKIAGTDRQGMLNDVTHAISSTQNTNIRSVNIDSENSIFEGTFIVDVQNTEHLKRLIEKLKKVPGIRSAERFEE